MAGGRLRDAGGGGNFATPGVGNVYGPPAPARTVTFRGRQLTPAQAAAVARYLYDNPAQDLPVGFLDRMNKQQIEKDAVKAALNPASHPERSYTSSADVGAALSPFDPRWSQQFLKPTSTNDQSAGMLGGLLVPAANFVKDVGRTTLGLPAFAYTTVTNPGQAARDFANSYKWQYGPLLHGDLNTFIHRGAEHPLGLALDTGFVASTAGRAAGLRNASVPMERSVTADRQPVVRGTTPEGDTVYASAVRPGSLTFNPDKAQMEGGLTVQPYASPNPVARALQHRFDRYSEAHPDQLWTGARARITRALPYSSERELDRQMQRGVPFDQMRMQLSPAENVAYDAIRRYGDAAPQRLEQEIQMRLDRIARGGDPIEKGRVVVGYSGGEPVTRMSYQLKGGTGRETTLDPAQAETRMGLLERKAQERTIAQLSSAREHVTNPSQLLQDTVTRGRALTEWYQGRRIAAGELTPEQAAAHLDMSSRLATGGRFVETPAPSPALVEARRRVADYSAQYERAVAARERDIVGRLAAAKQAVRDVGPPPGPVSRPVTRAEAEARLEVLQRAENKEIDQMVKTIPFNKSLNAKINLDRRSARLAHQRATKAMKARGMGAPELKLPPSVRERDRQAVIADIEAAIAGNFLPPELQGFAARREEINTLEAQLAAGPEAGPRHWLDDPIMPEEQAAKAAAAGAAPYGVVHDPLASVKAREDWRARRQKVRRRTIGSKLTGPPGMFMGARGDATVERLGAAGSVAKDRLARLEAAALRRHGVVPGEKGGRELVGGQPAGKGAFYAPDIEKLTPTVAAQRIRGVLGKQKPLTRRSEGVLFEQGRTRRDARLTTEGFAQTIRHERQRADIQRLLASSRPLNNSLPGGVEDGWVAINPEGIKLATGFRMAPEVLENLTPREIARVLNDEAAKFHAAAFPNAEELRNLPPQVRAKVRQVRQEYADALTQDIQRERFSRLAAIFDLTNNITKSSLIYLKPSYVVTNRVGNYAFLGIQQGLHTPRSLARTSGLVRRLSEAGWAPEWVSKAADRMNLISEETRRKIEYEVGGGGAHAIGAQGRGVVRDVVQSIADWSGRMADRNPRVAAWLREAEKRGVKTDAQINELIDNPARRAELNQISEAAEQSMVKFRGLSQFERRVVSRAIFIYPWVKGASRYGARLALDKPGRASVLAHAGDAGANEQAQLLGHVVSYLDSLIPTSKPYQAFGTTVVNVSNPNPVTPIGTAGEVAQAVGGAIGLTPTKRNLAPIQFATPVLKALTEATLRYDTFRRRAYPDKQSSASIFLHSLLGTSDRPNVPLLQSIQTAFRSPQTTPFEGKPGSQPNYVREGGVVAALKQAFLGSTRERQLNLPAAQAKGREEQLDAMDPVPRSVERTKDHQSDLVAEAIKVGIIKSPNDVPGLGEAFVAEQARFGAYAHEAEKLGVPVNRLKLIDRMKVDLDLAVEAGLIDRTTADTALEALRGLSPNQLKTQRAQLLRQLFPWGELLTMFRSEVRKAGGTA